MSDIFSCLTDIYGDDVAVSVFERLESLLEQYSGQLGIRKKQLNQRNVGRLSQQDSILITYGDQVRDSSGSPLRVLLDFCNQQLLGVVSGIHILPFFPYSSDDGFSVIDYRQVNPDLGSWEEVSRLGQNFRLMFDLVINHASAQSEWFQAFLQAHPRYADYFIVMEGNPDLSQVVRPRTSPLLTRFETASGVKAVWTTFSADQIDLNYHNPEILLEIIDILLFYVVRGAEFIRLDAIAYLWKEIGTPCLHHSRTHRLVQLLRAILDQSAPWVGLITETNVPHVDNISYFGDGKNEAQLVYNFALPPLVLHTFHTGDSRQLSNWASTLSLPSDRTTFFNFLASHDGIGINPARGILSEPEIQVLVDRTTVHGGYVSSKSNPDGSSSPYELNIDYFDALSDPGGNEPENLQIDRFLCAQAIMLSLVGVPGIYFHSLFGSRGWLEGVKITGQNRTINRQKLEKTSLEAELSDPSSLRSRVFGRYQQLLKARASSPAFDPHGSQRVMEYGNSIFALLRIGGDPGQRVLCLHNITASPQTIALDLWAFSKSEFTDLISGQAFPSSNKLIIPMRPYQVLWLLIESMTK